MDVQRETESEHLVLVVHGIGDPRPGETVDLLTRSLTRSAPLVDQKKTVWLEESWGDSRNSNTFPCHYHDVEFNGVATTMAEVFWGDLSRVKRGIVGAILGLFQVIFGLRYVAHQAADQDKLSVSCLQWMGTACANFLQGPLSAANIILVALTLGTIGLETLTTTSYLDSHAADLTALGIGLLIFTLGLFTGFCSGNCVFRRLLKWVSAISLILAIIAAVRIWSPGVLGPLGLGQPEMKGMVWYGYVFVNLVSVLWLALTTLTVLLFASWIPAVLASKTNRYACHVALIVPALTVGLWGQVIPTFWVFFIAGLGRFIHLEELSELFKSAVPLLGLQCVMSAILTLVLLYILAIYAWWRSKNTVQDYLKGKRSPRLIVHPAVLVASAIASLVGVSVTFYIFQLETKGILLEEKDFGELLTVATQISVMAILPIGSLGFMLVPYLRVGLDIVLDVINHFHFTEETDEKGKVDRQFPRRTAIENRLKSVMSYFSDSSGNSPIKKLTIVSHSQGTIISINVLNSPDCEPTFSRFCEISLVTMGSPFHHIYQKYFQHKYPLLDHSHWTKMGERIQNRWTNIFRIDDFVGTHIQDPEQPELNQGDNLHIKECPVSAKGHSMYWVDKEVLDIFEREEILG